MPDYSRQRRAALRELFKLTGGDPRKQIRNDDFHKALNLPSGHETDVVVHQLAKLCQVEVGEFSDSRRIHYPITLTMLGVQEAEKMERTFWQRMWEDHFLFLGSIWTVATIILGKLADPLLKWLGWL